VQICASGGVQWIALPIFLFDSGEHGEGIRGDEQGAEGAGRSSRKQTGKYLTIVSVWRNEFTYGVIKCD